MILFTLLGKFSKIIGEVQAYTISKQDLVNQHAYGALVPVQQEIHADVNNHNNPFSIIVLIFATSPCGDHTHID